MGFLSSWEVVEANWRCCSTASCSRARVWLAVLASSANSSSPGGMGTRRLRSLTVISDIRSRIAATGRSVRPTTDHVIQAAKIRRMRALPAKKYSRRCLRRMDGSSMPA